MLGSDWELVLGLCSAWTELRTLGRSQQGGDGGGGAIASRAVVRLADVARALSGQDTQLFPFSLLGSGLQHGIVCFLARRRRRRQQLEGEIPAILLSLCAVPCAELLLCCVVLLL